VFVKRAFLRWKLECPKMIGFWVYITLIGKIFLKIVSPKRWSGFILIIIPIEFLMWISKAPNKKEGSRLFCRPSLPPWNSAESFRFRLSIFLLRSNFWVSSRKRSEHLNFQFHIKILWRGLRRVKPGAGPVFKSQFLLTLKVNLTWRLTSYAHDVKSQFDMTLNVISAWS
jgi:hypothetical protein